MKHTAQIVFMFVALAACHGKADTAAWEVTPSRPTQPAPQLTTTGPEVREVACPGSIDDLPEASWLNPADPRLHSHRLRIVMKSARRITTFSDGVRDDARANCFPIALGYDGRTGPKREEGDRRTPEGWYQSSDKPHSQFYGAIAIHYPNEQDVTRAVRDERIDRETQRQILRALRNGQKPPQNTALGGEILIHGGGSTRDWTLGCIALENDDLDKFRATGPDNQAGWTLILP